MDNFGTSERLRRALILKTGQTTSYANNDDGQLQKGEPHRYYVLSTGQYAGTTNVTLNGKTDVHSNQCVFERGSGKMWSSTPSASVGPASDGKLPWTTNGSGEGIFAYVAAANAAMVAGYSDWRAPYDKELQSIREMEAPNALPEPAFFPLWQATNFWSSTTQPNVTTNAMQISFLTGGNGGNPKTNNYLCALVRGPV